METDSTRKPVDLKKILTEEVSEALLMTANVAFAKKAYQAVEVNNNNYLRKKLPDLLAAASDHWAKAEQLSNGRGQKRKLNEITRKK